MMTTTTTQSKTVRRRELTRPPRPYLRTR
jgi:hypothetical protein